MALNERIKQILIKKGWQDQELAKQLGVSKATLSQRFTKSNWTLDEVMAIGHLTGYSLQWICEGYGPELDSELNTAIAQYMAGVNRENVVTEPESKYAALEKRLEDLERKLKMINP